MWLAEKGGQLYSHPYDNGAYENLTTVSAAYTFCCLMEENTRFYLENGFTRKNLKIHGFGSIIWFRLVDLVLFIFYRLWDQEFCAGFAPSQDILARVFVSKPSTIASWDCRLQIKDDFVVQSCYTPDNIHTSLYL